MGSESGEDSDHLGWGWGLIFSGTGELEECVYWGGCIRRGSSHRYDCGLLRPPKRACIGKRARQFRQMALQSRQFRQISLLRPMPRQLSQRAGPTAALSEGRAVDHGGLAMPARTPVACLEDDCGMDTLRRGTDVSWRSFSQISAPIEVVSAGIRSLVKLHARPTQLEASSLCLSQRSWGRRLQSDRGLPDYPLHPSQSHLRSRGTLAPIVQ